ncbi:MAG: RNA polymerase sigma factor [Emcibacter sp.]|nr:RNA polymerase sigma factor [Emcibacter sp.]
MILKRVEDIPDEQLIVRIADGDRTAYKMLVERHLRIFLGFAARVVGDWAEAEDIMQEAFLRVWKNAAKWDQGRKTLFTTWFYRVVMNLCIDVKRKRRSKPTLDLSEAFGVISDTPKADEYLSNKQMAAQIAVAMEQLPQRQRIAMSLCYLQGLGNKQAAEILGISTGAIESLLVRGRKTMAEILKAQKQEFFKETI